MNESVKVFAADAIDALNNLDDYARMGGITPSGAVMVLLNYIKQTCEQEDLNDQETMQHIQFFESEYMEACKSAKHSLLKK